MHRDVRNRMRSSNEKIPILNLKFSFAPVKRSHRESASRSCEHHSGHLRCRASHVLRKFSVSLERNGERKRDVNIVNCFFTRKLFETLKSWKVAGEPVHYEVPIRKFPT